MLREVKQNIADCDENAKDLLPWGLSPLAMSLVPLPLSPLDIKGCSHPSLLPQGFQPLQFFHGMDILQPPVVHFSGPQPRARAPEQPLLGTAANVPPTPLVSRFGLSASGGGGGGGCN